MILPFGAVHMNKMYGQPHYRLYVIVEYTVIR
jgi:hypothetical protein